MAIWSLLGDFSTPNSFSGVVDAMGKLGGLDRRAIPVYYQMVI
jgi:hypothetical protein